MGHGRSWRTSRAEAAAGGASAVTALLVILILIVANGVLAMSEMALASSRRGRLEERADAGSDGARRALALYDDPNRFLATVQIGISLVGVLSGAFAGRALAGPLGERLVAAGVPADAADPLAFALVVAAITYLSLVVGELVPKRLALANPEAVSSRVARPMAAASWMATPLVTVLSWSTEALLKPFGVAGRREDGTSPEEISGLLEQGRRVGHFAPAEVEMIENVFDLEERRVRSMLTPRRDVTWLDVEAPWSELRQALLDASHSRLPVARGELDRLIGVVHVHALLDRCLLNEPIDLEAMAEPALAVPESLGALALLDRFRERGTRFAVVLDEYGGVEGIVTAGDVLVALLGELAAGSDETDPMVVRHGDETFDLDGRLYLEELKDLLEIQTLPREEERAYRTLGGLITSLLERIPEPGDMVVAEAWSFTVREVDGPRVDRVEVRPARPEPEEDRAAPEVAPIPARDTADGGVGQPGRGGDERSVRERE